MNNFIAGVKNELRETFDPKYVRFQNDIKDFSVKVGAVGLAALVAGIALLIIGIVLVETPVVIICLSLALPCLYVSYNSIKLYVNLGKISKNPSLYENHFSLQPRIKSQDLKDALGKDTFGAQWLIDGYVDEIDADLKKAFPD